MYLKSSGYLSKYTGSQIDNAIGTMRNYDEELAQKVDKTTTVNGNPLSENVELDAQDVGALSDNTLYGSFLSYNSGNLKLLDQNLNDLGDSVDIFENWDGLEGLVDILNSKQNIITSQDMLSSDLVYDTDNIHKFATAEQLTQIATNEANITAIEAKIPSQASSENQLADKNFVNSSVSTNTAYFIGTFNSVAELEAYSGTLTNNDYGFVISVDSAGNTLYNRYKYNSNLEQWIFEYSLNNSSFTANQWASINSGSTTTNIGQIETNRNDIALIDSIIGGFGDIVTHNASEFATSTEGGLANTALQPGDNISELNNDSGYISGISSSDVTTALGFTPYNSTNPSGYISGISSSDVTTALGFTPEDVLNKVTSLSNTSTDTQYPSAKVVYDELSLKQDSSTAVTHTASTAVGDTITPVYIDSNGIATPIDYTIEASVPVGAVFTDTTYVDFTGADSITAGVSGLVPAPSAGDENRFLRGDGTWSSGTVVTFVNWS